MPRGIKGSGVKKIERGGGWSSGLSVKEASPTPRKSSNMTSAESEQLTLLANLEKEAREAFYYWTGRAHPNSLKMITLKGAHNKAMSELIRFQQDLGVIGKHAVKPEPLPDAATPPDLLPAEEGVRKFDSGHRVGEVKQTRKDTKLGAELLNDKSTS